jgi:hypothetical protein
MMIQWDFDRVWAYCGGTHGVVALCAKAETGGLAIPPSPGTAAVWKARKRIPIEWLPTIIHHCLTEVQPVSSASLFLIDHSAEDSLDDFGL